MARRERFLAATAALLVLGACGKLTGASGGSTVTVGRADTGKTVTMAVGDALVVDLGPAPTPLPAAPAWKLYRYPTQVLTLVTSDPSAGRFEFRARAAGTGQMLVLNVFACGPPMEPQVAGAPCPVEGGGGTGVQPGPGLQPGPLPRPPFWIYRLTIRVTA